MNEKKNIFRRLFERRDNTGDTSDLKNPKQWLLNAMGISKTSTGVRISETTAMNYSAVYACVRIISETIASLPLNIYKRLDKGKEKAIKHPLYRALHLRPNTDMTSFTWREFMGVQLNTYGNSYNYKLRNLVGDVIGFYPLLASRMDIETINNEIIYRYTFNDGVQRIIPRGDFIHIPGLSFDGIIGRSPITMAREAIGLGIALEEFGARFFSNGTNVGGVAQHPGKLTAQGRDNLTKSINETYQGLGSAHKLMLLEEGMTYQKIIIPPNDAQFIESRRFQVEEIARIFRVPKHLLQDLLGATFSNIEHQSIDFVVHTIRPWLVRIEQALNADPELFPDEKYFAEFVVDGLLRGDVATRFAAYATAIQNAVYSPNDVLEFENMNGYEGGDKHWIQLNMQPVENAGIAPEPVIPIAPALPVEPKAIEGKSILLERLQKAYKPLFVNTFIRILKREKVDLVKLSREELTDEIFNDYVDNHVQYLKSQIKPVVFAFSEALGAETKLKDMDITIFASNYADYLTARYIGDTLTDVRTNVTSEETDAWISDLSESLSLEQTLQISSAFIKYINRIGVV